MLSLLLYIQFLTKKIFWEDTVLSFNLKIYTKEFRQKESFTSKLLKISVLTITNF